MAPKTIGAKQLLDISLNTRRPRLSFSISNVGYCYVCGHKDGFELRRVINDELTTQWGLTISLRKSFDVRESSVCRNCTSSLRSNLQARAICELLAPGSKFLDEAVKTEQLRRQKIAEINACGALHTHLAALPKLYYSEYMPKDKSIRHEDLHKLSYETDSLDAVLTSETLEHVPDWPKAMSEIHRVLSPGGLHIFTVPAILTRMTRLRTVVEGGKEKHLLPRSFHGCTQGITTSDYIVRSEFGADFRQAVDTIGFKTYIYYRNLLRLSDPNLVFVSRKAN